MYIRKTGNLSQSGIQTTMSDWISEDLFQMLHTVSSSANKWRDEDNVEINGGETNKTIYKLKMQMKHEYEEWILNKNEGDLYSIFTNIAIFGQCLCTLEAGPNKTKKKSRHRSFFFFLSWASHLRWNGSYVSISERHA